MARLDNSASLDLVSVSASTIFNEPNLGTATFWKFPDTSVGSPAMAIRRIAISNKHATAYVAFKLTSEASPSFSASPSGTIAANSGVEIAGLSTYFVNFKSNLSLWLIASGASTPCQVIAYDVKA